MTEIKTGTLPTLSALAGELHDTDCGWNCPGHGIMQERVNQRYEAMARAVLRLLTEDPYCDRSKCPDESDCRQGEQGRRE